METISGKQTRELDAAVLAARLSQSHGVLVDVGTGDGRYVHSVAQSDPECLVIGIDACRENLRVASRRAPPNALYLIANALHLPCELRGLAAHITINFPWGSLLAGLVHGDSGLLGGLHMLALPGALLEVRLNAGALVEISMSLEQGALAVRHALYRYGFAPGRSAFLDAAALRTCPTTWARRLATGRDPRALYLHASLQSVDRPPCGENVGHRKGDT